MTLSSEKNLSDIWSHFEVVGEPTSSRKRTQENSKLNNIQTQDGLQKQHQTHPPFQTIPSQTKQQSASTMSNLAGRIKTFMTRSEAWRQQLANYFPPKNLAANLGPDGTTFNDTTLVAISAATTDSYADFGPCMKALLGRKTSSCSWPISLSLSFESCGRTPATWLLAIGMLEVAGTAIFSPLMLSCTLWLRRKLMVLGQ